MASLIGKPKHPRWQHKLWPEESGVWLNMRTRCNNPRYIEYRLYGGRGIKVCERWAVFANFMEDMGPRPTPKHTIERRDSNGNYEPNNCYWAPPGVQGFNRSNNHVITYNGKTQTLTEWANEYGLKSSTLRMRLRKYGYPIDKALVSNPWERNG